MPMEHHQKWMSALTLIAVAVAFGLAMHIAFTSYVGESFANFGSEEGFVAGSDLATYNEAMLEEAFAFLSNTDIIQNTFGAYKAYGNINAAASRELNFFNAVKDSVDNQGVKTKNASSITTLAYKEQTHRMYLLVSLGIIIALTVVAYIAFDESPLAQTRFVYAGIFLSVIAFVLYVFEVNSHVHTDPKKYYWGNPGDPDRY